MRQSPILSQGYEISPSILLGSRANPSASIKLIFVGSNPKTDYAFKKIFGSDQSQDILISFLNAIKRQLERLG